MASSAPAAASFPLPPPVPNIPIVDLKTGFASGPFREMIQKMWAAIQGSGGIVATMISGSGIVGSLAKFTGAATIGVGDLSGDVSTAGSLATSLAPSGVTAATYGDALNVPQIAVDAKGRVTSAADVSIGTGVNGTFITADAMPKTVTVVNGLITSIV